MFTIHKQLVVLIFICVVDPQTAVIPVTVKSLKSNFICSNTKVIVYWKPGSSWMAWELSCCMLHIYSTLGLSIHISQLIFLFLSKSIQVILQPLHSGRVCVRESVFKC